MPDVTGSLPAEIDIFAVDSAELGAARELYYAADDLFGLLKANRNLFNDDVRDALDSFGEALAKASTYY